MLSLIYKAILQSPSVGIGYIIVKFSLIKSNNVKGTAKPPLFLNKLYKDEKHPQIMAKKIAADRTYVTLDKAEKMIPTVEKLVFELQLTAQALELLDTVEIEVEEDNQDAMRYITQFNKDYHYLSYTFYERLDRLEKMGCVLKDLDEGLIDFRSKVGKKDILLCWKVGDKNIEYWHETNAGYENRKKIINLERKLNLEKKK